MGPLCFVCHINDLNTVCDCVRYVDDSTMYEDCDIDDHDSKIQVVAVQGMKWIQENLMEVKTDKFKEMVVYFVRKEVPQVIMQSRQIERERERVSEFKLLGIIFNKQLTWDGHAD